MSYLQHIVIDGLDYQIALPHHDTDYIQGKIAKESAPYELPMLRAMVERVSPGDLVLDVGANIGNHSLYLAAAGCKVHAFEPNASLCEALQQSIEANGFESNIEVYNLGLGTQTGKAYFNHLDSNNLGAQSLSLDDDESSDIRIIRLDDVNFEKEVKAIKIDVEGMELPVLQGAARLIESDRPALYIECQTAKDFASINGWVSKCGYHYWDTFNATPTHLFLHETVLDKLELIDRLTCRLVLESYRTNKMHEQLSTSLNEARIKYREASRQIDKLKTELQDTKSRRIQSESQLAAVSEQLQERGHKLAELKEKLGERQQRTIELLRRADQLNTELAKVKQGRAEALQTIKTLQSSATFKAGRYLRSATRSPIDALKLPLRLWRLRITLSTKRDAIEHQRLSQPPFSLPSSSLAVDHARSVKEPVGTFLKEFSPSGISSLRVACIMDDFTYGSYQFECELQQLTPDNWQDELDAFQPELLFIESAWRGKDALWGSKIGHTSNELQGVVAWCRSQGIPTVFWNKEDPVHFETFLNTARLFDFVFTTDIACIPRYKAALEHNRIFFLPFACQPTVHNPIEKYERQDAFCFAGAYYVRYPDRTRDLEDFVKELPSFRPLAIYDRNYGKNDPDYQFPETYQPHIIGTLPYDQIDKAYKGYRYAINLNSIKQSQTMFARRIYELLGSNTLVVSNYSRGVRLMFGDLVVSSDSGAEIKRRLEALEKKNRTDRLRLAGLRKVMLEHTYGERITYVLSKVTGREITQPLPSFKVLAAADTLEDVQRLVAHVQAQRGIDASLTLMLASGLSGAEVRAALPEPTFALELLHAEDVQGKKLAELADGACWVAGMVADDYCGPHYLLDIALATRYSDAHAIGKGAWYAWQQGQCTINDPDATYRPAPRLTARRSAITRALAEDIDAIHWLTKLSEWTYEYSQQLAIDPYNYCADAIQGGPAEIRETVDDLPANHGISLKELIGIAETMPPMQHQEIDTPYFNGRELAHLLSGRPFVLHTNHEALSTEEQVDETIHLSRNQAIDAVLSGSTLQIRSELPDGKHEYLYSPVELDCNELLARLPESTDRKIPIHFEMEPGLNLSLVMLYLDADKNRIGHVIQQPNRNCSIGLPDDAAYLRFGLRIYAGGTARIQRLLLGHLDLEPQVILGQSDVLLLTNHFPSYDDLYRNCFLHSRVRGYREHGMHVDVFRLRENQPIAWHEFQDIDVTTGSQEALRRLLANGGYRHVLVHFLDPSMWAVLKDFIDTIPVTVWVHGAEVHPWHRRKFNIHTPEQEQAARQQSEQRMAFWRGLLQPMPANLRLVFVSKTFSEEVMEDLGFRLPEDQYAIIHNPIDTELFAYTPKSPDQRTKILSIRPYTSRIYANDLSVEAIKLLSIEPFFNELEFRLIGDGELFEETVAPLRDFSNVTVERRFLTQHEIASLHKEYGIFLCPSRMDTQGVSRDEAMSSGLVPITSAIAAIPEFADEDCGILAPTENFERLAQGISELYNDPDRFAALSRKAAKRVRKQSGKELVISQEISVFSRPSVAGTSTPEKSA
jgi:FkbM family methyltransferase